MKTNSDPPNYYKALKHVNAKKIVKSIGERRGTARFSEISHRTEIKDNTLVHHLNVLIQYGVVEMQSSGPYKLKFKTPLCYIFEKKPKSEEVSYMGLLGNRDKKREQSETNIALRLLKEEGLDIGDIHVVTSKSAARDWRSGSSNNLKVNNWILCDDAAITKIDEIKNKIQPILLDLIKERLVIMDCTSFNKPATIAMYELAQTYFIPLFYIYEPLMKLKWLISMDDLKEIFK